MDINSAITIMKAYKELDDRIKQFADKLEAVIIKPRIELKLGNVSSIEIRGVSHPAMTDLTYRLSMLHRTQFAPRKRMEILP